jgi:hypothetical protein
MDEKWSFVGKKQANCGADDLWHGDCWDHVAFDPEHRRRLPKPWSDLNAAGR